jgi:branched-chain amino acid aminotransferase
MATSTAAQVGERVVYLNGEIIAESAASLSIFDRGFIWGDAVYDAGRTFEGRPFRIWEHVQRLYRSMKYARLDIGMTAEAFHEKVLEVIRHNATLLEASGDYLCRMHVSRGVMPDEGSVHRGGDMPPTVVVFCMPINLAIFAKYYEDDSGMPLVIPSTRRTPPQCLSPKAKVSAKMNNFIAAFEARDVDENAQPLMLDVNGYVTESQGSNFMFVSNGTLHMPNRSGALVGESMTTVTELAEKLGIPVEEGLYTPYDVYNADESFLTAGTFCVMPVGRIDNHSMNEPAPGPVTRRLLDAWSELVGVDIVGQIRDQSRLTNTR